MKNKRLKGNQKGFTLIESIVTLVMVSFVATMLFTFSQPLYNSAGAFGWFNDEMRLQNDMERILADYKNQIHENNSLDAGVFRQYVINNYPLVNAAKTGFITSPSTFTSGMTYTTGWPPQSNSPSGATPVLIVTLQRNERILSMVFTFMRGL